MPRRNILHRALRLDRFTPGVARGLVDTLFEQDTTLLQGAVVLVLLALVGFGETRSWWMLIWGALSLPLAAMRVRLARAYRRHPDSLGLEQWVARHLTGAWLAGALWGGASVGVVEPDPNIRFLFIIVQTSLVAAGAIRNCAFPLVANGQVLCALLPLLVALLSKGSLFYVFVALFVSMYIAAMHTIIGNSHQYVTRALDTAEQNSALAQRLTQSNQQLQELNLQLESVAATDALTRLLNRRGIDLQLDQEWRQATSNATSLSLMMLDVDHFKQFNDLYGHLNGDDCLRAIAGVLLAAARGPHDVVGRYGGEEFMIILPDAGERAALVVAERVRSAVAALNLPHAASEAGRVTLSIGLAIRDPALASGPSGLIRIADEALYRAKRRGRNRIELARSEPAA